MELSDVIKELEEEEQMRNKRVTAKIFKSMLNQPSLVTINSANAVKIGSQNGFSSFTADFARPILDVDTLQLVSTSIPQCNPSIPDTATTFWYYKLSNLTGTTPCLTNLYYVRLLPSFYKPEFISMPDNCGFNKTFPNYTSLATQLAKSCVRDIGYENLQLAQADGYDLHQYFPFIPEDISITYNSAYNKFQMTGNNSKFAYQAWRGGEEPPYSIGDVVVYENKAYVSLQNDNIEHNPATETGFWKYNPGIQVVPQWKATTPYRSGNLVSFNNLIFQYIGTGISYNDPPPGEGLSWFTAASLYNIPYRYLITGYDDPNVAKLQGELFTLEWEPSRYYMTGERVKFEDRLFEAITETNLYVPGNVSFYIPNTTYLPFSVNYYESEYRRFNEVTGVPDWVDETIYYEDDLVIFDGFIYICLQTTVGSIPNSSPAFWKVYTADIQDWQVLVPNEPQPAWNSTTVYNFDDMVEYNGSVYKSIIVNESFPAWQGTNIIPVGTTVTIGGNKYTAVISSTNVNPLSGALTTWFPGLPYVVGNGGWVEGVGAYVCIQNITGGTTSPNGDADHWMYVGATANLALWWTNEGPPIQNLNKVPTTNPDYWRLQAEHPFDAQPFVSGQVYPKYAMAYFNNGLYIAKTDTTTTDAENWFFVGYNVWEPDVTGLGTVTGLGGLTKEHDFIIARWTAGPEIIVEPVPFPENTGGQPYSLTPKRLLNSILGFTWNAVFVPELLSSVAFASTFDPITIDRRGIDLYNRLRPVPNYESAPPPEELLSAFSFTPPATTTYTYTAEGYANLVYSSIIQIYTNIVGGATLDTMRDTNLLATTSMNCGNLGIAYHANYIDNPLMRVAGGDIDSVYIELRDEMGDPFFLTNNAVMSLTFKVTYRERPRVE